MLEYLISGLSKLLFKLYTCTSTSLSISLHATRIRRKNAETTDNHHLHHPKHKHPTGDLTALHAAIWLKSCMEMQISLPAGLITCTQFQNYLQLVHSLSDQPTNSPDVKPTKYWRYKYTLLLLKKNLHVANLFFRFILANIRIIWRTGFVRHNHWTSNLKKRPELKINLKSSPEGKNERWDECLMIKASLTLVQRILNSWL